MLEMDTCNFSYFFSIHIKAHVGVQDLFDQLFYL